MKAHPYCGCGGEVKDCHLCERLYVRYPVTEELPRSPTVGEAVEYLAMQVRILDGSEALRE